MRFFETPPTPSSLRSVEFATSSQLCDTRSTNCAPMQSGNRWSGVKRGPRSPRASALFRRPPSGRDASSSASRASSAEPIERSIANSRNRSARCCSASARARRRWRRCVQRMPSSPVCARSSRTPTPDTARRWPHCARAASRPRVPFEPSVERTGGCFACCGKRVRYGRRSRPRAHDADARGPDPAPSLARARATAHDRHEIDAVEVGLHEPMERGVV